MWKLLGHVHSGPHSSKCKTMDFRVLVIRMEILVVLANHRLYTGFSLYESLHTIRFALHVYGFQICCHKNRLWHDRDPVHLGAFIQVDDINRYAVEIWECLSAVD